MKEFGIGFIILFIIFIPSVLIPYFRNHERLEKKVKETGKKLALVKQLNEKYSGLVDTSHFQFTLIRNCASLNEYRKTDFLDALEEWIHNHSLNNAEWDRIRSKGELCRVAYANYLSEYNKIMNDTSLEYEKENYNDAERRLCEEAKLTFKGNPSVEVTVQYTSPSGRNSYRADHKFLWSSVLEVVERLRKEEAEAEAYKQSKQYQRSLLTASLRYDILRRDGFRCVICGASASEGAKLHVDHILPVAKGGKTVPNNLRTLCADCNLGKSDKYIEGEIN